jgi:protein-S-isoprenylcysteine O-methyltransferase Ste14
MEPTTSRLRPSGKVFVVCGLWLVMLGTYFLVLRPALLPEDSRYIGSSLEAIRSAAPGLERWLGHVFNVMGGFMVATGATTVLVAWRLLARRERGTLAVLLVAGAASVGLMSATNFLLGSNFRWLLLVPALLWLAGLICYLRECATSSTTKNMPAARKATLREPDSGDKNPSQ